MYVYIGAGSKQKGSKMKSSRKGSRAVSQKGSRRGSVAASIAGSQPDSPTDIGSPGLSPERGDNGNMPLSPKANNSKKMFSPRTSQKNSGKDKFGMGSIDYMDTGQTLTYSLNEVLLKKNKAEKKARALKKKMGRVDFGNVLEMCCVYRREDTAVVQVAPVESTVVNDVKAKGSIDRKSIDSIEERARERLGSLADLEKERNKLEALFIFKHTGTLPTPEFKPKTPLSRLVFTKIQDNMCQAAMKILPTHHRFWVSDDVTAVGAFLVIRLNSDLWTHMRSNEAKYHQLRAKDKKEHREAKREAKKKAKEASLRGEKGGM
jgi:hypothetical protein